MVLFLIEKCGFVVWQFRLGTTVNLLIDGILTKKAIYVLYWLSILTSIRRSSPWERCSDAQGQGSSQGKHSACGRREGSSSKPK